MKPVAVLCVLAALCCVASAARQAPFGIISAESGFGGLSAVQSNWHTLFGPKDKEEEQTGSVIVRFTVPPSEADNFEKAWLKLEEKVQDEKGLIVFDLKKTKIDNTLYVSYGEFETHRDMHDHMACDAFMDFAKCVDDLGVHWEVQLLRSESEELEEHERGTHRGRRAELSDAALAMLPADATEQQVTQLYAELRGREDMAHVAISYYVPPGEAKGFVDAWTDMAKDTIKEKGNRMYSLSRVITDNTRWIGYGTWESMRDYIDHLQSKHMDKFFGAVADNDVVWFLAPLEKIGHQPE